MRKKRIWMAIALVGVIVIVIGLWPIFSLLIAKAINAASGCALNDSYPAPCVIGGTDYGDTLVSMSLMPWFMFYTLPLGLVALIIWIVVAVATRTKHRSPSPAGSGA